MKGEVLVSLNLGKTKKVEAFLANADPSGAQALDVLSHTAPLQVTQKYDLFAVDVKGPAQPKALVMASAQLLEAIQVQYKIHFEPTHFMASYFHAPETSLQITFTNFPRTQEP